MEARVGFEPTEPGINRLDGFQDRYFNPLSHRALYLYVWCLSTESNNSGIRPTILTPTGLQSAVGKERHMWILSKSPKRIRYALKTKPPNNKKPAFFRERVDLEQTVCERSRWFKRHSSHTASPYMMTSKHILTNIDVFIQVIQHVFRCGSRH